MKKHIEQHAISLYRDGLSALKISQKLHISTHQIYGALKNSGIPRRSPAERYASTPLSFQYHSPQSLSEWKLFTAGLMLYFGEGAKTTKTVDLANSDPRILCVFLRFLRIIFRIDEKRLRFYLYCFSNQNVDQLITFWAKRLDVSVQNFTKPYIRNYDVNKRRIMPWGVLHIRYNDKKLLEKILSLCSDLAAQFIES